MNGSLCWEAFGLSSDLVNAAHGVELAGSARVNGHQLLHFPCVVTATRERSADHLEKSKFFFALEAVALELLRSDEPVHAQVFGAWR